MDASSALACLWVLLFQDAPRSETVLGNLQAEILAADPVTAPRFEALVREVLKEQDRRKLPSFMQDPESAYSPELIQFRNEVYGPLLLDEEVIDFLREKVQLPAQGFSMVPSTAATLLADHPSLEHLEFLFKGHRANAAAGSELTSASITRQLGRCIKGLQGSTDPEVLAGVEEVLETLRVESESGPPRNIGAAIEALYRAGAEQDAFALVNRVLADDSDPQRMLDVLQGCTRMLNLPGVDPSLKLRAQEIARQLTGECLGVEPEENSLLRGVSQNARTLRSAMTLLQGDAASQFAFLLGCYRDPRASAMLGMDGIQSLRVALEAVRAKLSETEREELDSLFIEELRVAGRRLFELSEEPMDEEEVRTFFERRNARYNAASYLVAQVAKDEILLERLFGDADLPAYLAALISARSQELEGETGEKIYLRVQEKLENRVLCCEILERLERKKGSGLTELDVFEELFQVLLAELDAPAAVLEDALVFRTRHSPWLGLEIPIKREPADRWVADECLQAFVGMGFVVLVSQVSYRIQYPENPGQTAGDGPGPTNQFRRRGRSRDRDR